MPSAAHAQRQHCCWGWWMAAAAARPIFRKGAHTMRDHTPLTPLHCTVLQGTDGYMYCDGLRIDDIRSAADASPFYLYSKERIRCAGFAPAPAPAPAPAGGRYGGSLCRQSCCGSPLLQTTASRPALGARQPHLAGLWRGAAARTLQDVPGSEMYRPARGALTCPHYCCRSRFAARTTRRTRRRCRAWTPLLATLSRPTTTSASCRCASIYLCVGPALLVQPVGTQRCGCSWGWLPRKRGDLRPAPASPAVLMPRGPCASWAAARCCSLVTPLARQACLFNII